MSKEKQETIEDIVAEMRNESHAGDESCLEWVGEKMRTRADRIEAAAKREREATREKPSQVGNSAKMREAKESDMNPINPVCRPATENEINYGEAKWCAICTSECDSKGKDELVMCDYFKTNDNDPIVTGCPSLMPHALTGGFDSVAPAEEGTPMNAAKMREALESGEGKRGREMSNKQETIADIVAEMRQAEATWHRSEIAQLPTQYLKEWSDRIEAARQREVAELRECLKETMVDSGSGRRKRGVKVIPQYAKSLLCSYAKKMRDIIHEVQSNETDDIVIHKLAEVAADCAWCEREYGKDER